MKERKKEKEKQVRLLIILIILLFIINYPFLNKLTEGFLSNYETAYVERVIDGDTIVIENKTSVRMLGINSPERSELYYDEAKQYLENLVLDKTVKLEFGKEKTDRYNRLLRYVHINNKNINLKLVEEGFANFYFPSGKDRYYKDFEEAWEECIDKNINLCEKSEEKCAECVELKEFNHKKQEIVLYNKCNVHCDLTDWTIKDEGRKKFVFGSFILKSNKEIKIVVGDSEDTNDILFWNNEDYVWTNTGDSLFLRDRKGKLVLWRSY